MKKYIAITILLFMLQSCQTDCTDDYEMKVLVEIFDDLVEEMGALDGYKTPPPPLLSTSDSNNNIYDTIEYLREVDKVQANRKMKDTVLVIAVLDTLFSCINENLDIEYIKEQLTNQDYIEVLDTMRTTSIISQPLNISKIRKSERFTLKYYSEFPQGIKIWEREKYDFLFSGVLEISRIYFDAKKQFGLLYSSYICGRLCGEGAIICIHKIKDKWVIEKKILLWVS